MGWLLSLGVKASSVTEDEHFAPWFVEIGDRLLNKTNLLVKGATYRFAELEVYYHGPGHFDPFPHCDPLQRENGRWYFHRTRGQYRDGSFKGLDLTLGDGTAYFGILIRSIVEPNGTAIVGPSLTVDHLLAQTDSKDVASLDRAINERTIWDRSSPLFIRESDAARTATVYASARVGLSLKRATNMPEAVEFIGRPYRFLIEPRSITKGKQQLVLALHRNGVTTEEIHQITGCQRKTVERTIAREKDSGKDEG